MNFIIIEFRLSLIANPKASPSIQPKINLLLIDVVLINAPGVQVIGVKA